MTPGWGQYDALGNVLLGVHVDVPLTCTIYQKLLYSLMALDSLSGIMCPAAVKNHLGMI